MHLTHEKFVEKLTIRQVTETRDDAAEDAAQCIYLRESYSASAGATQSEKAEALELLHSGVSCKANVGSSHDREGETFMDMFGKRHNLTICSVLLQTPDFQMMTPVGDCVEVCAIRTLHGGVITSASSGLMVPSILYFLTRGTPWGQE